MSATPLSHDLVVVGAGAAGLWVAARTAELGRSVLLLEKTRRAGTKILASGGTRCNLTTTLGSSQAALLFGAPGARFLAPAFRSLPPDALRAQFEELGLATLEAPLDKVFPASQSAREVRDCLLGRALKAGVEVRYLQEVQAVEPSSTGTWRIRLAPAGGAPVILECRSLCLCPGGRSYPRTGTTGDGYPWLEELQLELVTPVPALVPLTSSADWVHDLTGIARQGARVRLLDGTGRVLAERTRPVLFCHFGLSGPAAMDLSGVVTRGEATARRARADPPSWRASIDLVPELSSEELRHKLIAVGAAAGRPRLLKALGPMAQEALPRRLVRAVCGQAGLAAERCLAELKKHERHQLVLTLKGLAVPIDGTRGWDRAEVTGGGLALSALNPRTMEVNAHKQLFVCGELLDLDGPIGGLNFQAAFATADLAARALAKDT
ncbi:MAG: aminoacetone oxidase family FAD-binding enzyme [bacterium]|jgi:hypothetical protein|nr:aminoacetone oxidase family FAD-binding enzyme [Planctomycetota bacterium]HIL52499.1 aminoacetone oxidase family FAD-binding enzyme [Planctomycetota bacterium]